MMEDVLRRVRRDRVFRLLYRLAVLGLLVAILLLLACKPQTAISYPFTLTSEFDKRTVAVFACGRGGSGVITFSRTILTAAHVVGDCPIVVVYLGDGSVTVAKPESVSPTRDIARLFAPALVGYAPLEPAVAKRGDHVCMAVAVPLRAIKCGLVRKNRPIFGGLNHAIDTQKGNSGSAVYNTRGQIVGIVVTLDVAGGGNATPIPSGWVP